MINNEFKGPFTPPTVSNNVLGIYTSNNPKLAPISIRMIQSEHYTGPIHEGKIYFVLKPSHTVTGPTEAPAFMILDLPAVNNLLEAKHKMLIDSLRVFESKKVIIPSHYDVNRSELTTDDVKVFMVESLLNSDYNGLKRIFVGNPLFDSIQKDTSDDKNNPYKAKNNDSDFKSKLCEFFGIKVDDLNCSNYDWVMENVRCMKFPMHSGGGKDLVEFGGDLQSSIANYWGNWNLYDGLQCGLKLARLKNKKNEKITIGGESYQINGPLAFLPAITSHELAYESFIGEKVRGVQFVEVARPVVKGRNSSQTNMGTDEWKTLTFNTNQESQRTTPNRLTAMLN